MLATIYASRLLQLHLIPFTLPISLNSLDREGVRLLTPRDSQILPKPICRCRCYRAGDATKLKEELDEDQDYLSLWVGKGNEVELQQALSKYGG